MNSKFFLILSYVFFMWSTLVGFNILSGELDVTDLNETGQGNFIKQISFLINFAFAIVLLLSSKGVGTKFIKHEYSLCIVVMLAFCAFTLLNSYVVDVSIRRLIVTFIVLYSLVAYCMIFETANLFKVTSLTLLFFIFISVIACLTLPEAIHSSDAIDQQLIGSWKGIFTHKNVAGAIAAVSFILLYNGFGFSAKYLNVFSMLIALLFLIQTGSKTSISLVIIAVILSNKKIIGWMLDNSVYLIGIVLLSSPLIYLLIDYFLVLIENPESFTGRASIWKILLEIIYDYPVFGSGFQSLYHVGPYSMLTDYAGDWVQFVAHGHNGYIDLTAQIGILGFAVFSYTIMRPILLFIKAGLKSDNAYYICVFSIFFFFIAHNFTESSFLDTTRAGWFFIGLCFGVAFKEKMNASKHYNPMS